MEMRRRFSLLLISSLGLALTAGAPAARAGGRSASKTLSGGRKGTLALVFVLDRSGSMCGRKLQLLKQALRKSLHRFRFGDRVGVIQFDTTPQVLAALRPIGSGTALLAAVRKIRCGGGTAFLPALQATATLFAKVREIRARRHVVFLSDGQSSRAGVRSAIRSLALVGVTLSTIALGAGADSTFLTEMSRAAKGRHYKVTGAKLRLVLGKELRLLGR